MRTKLVLFFGALLLSSGCSTSYSLVSPDKQAWITNKTLFGSDETLYYCVSNHESGAKPRPVCYEPVKVQAAAPQEAPTTPKTFTPPGSGPR